MFIFLVILFVSTFSYGMQVYKQSEKCFIDNYINHSFNIISPHIFNVQIMCGMYESPNLKKNIQAIIQHTLNASVPINLGQVGDQQEPKSYFEASKNNELIFMYASFLES